MKTKYPYQPTISTHKLKKLTPITRKNIGTVMGHLNHFFNKPTIRLSGFNKEIIGFKEEIWRGNRIIRDVYSDYYIPNYLPYEAHCDFHPIWKNYLAGKEILYKDRPQKIPRLAISGKYTNGCIPLFIGDSYKIFGNRLIIMHKWDKLIHSTPWVRFNEFIQVKEHNPDQLREIRANGCISEITDILCDVREGYEYKYFSYIGDYIAKIGSELERILKKNYDQEKVEIPISGLYEDFTMVVFPLIALNPTNNENFVYFINKKGEKYNSGAKYIMDIINQKIEEDYKRIKEQKDLESIPDWDYDFDYGWENYED